MCVCGGGYDSDKSPKREKQDVGLQVAAWKEDRITNTKVAIKKIMPMCPSKSGSEHALREHAAGARLRRDLKPANLVHGPPPPHMQK